MAKQHHDWSTEQALVGYLESSRKILTRLQLAHPARWRVRGLSDEEVRDALLLALLEHARTAAPTSFDSEAALQVFKRELSALRRRFRLPITPLDFREVVLAEREPSQEERLAELELDACRARARARAELALSRPQRRWFAAMKLAARSGEFFQASQELNLSAASRTLGKHRSSAQRAYLALQTHFSRELERVK